MRETVRSLRIYLILCGVLGTASNLQALVARDRSLFDVLVLVSIVGAAGLLYLGLRLQHLLRNHLHQALGILHFNMVAIAMFLAVSLAYGGGGIAVGQLVLGLLILWYIRGNVKRLAGQESSLAGVAA